MKQILSIALLFTLVGLNAALDGASITAIKPAVPIAGVATKFTLTVVANSLSLADDTKVIFYKSGDTTTETVFCNVKPASATATTVDCSTTIPEAAAYTAKAGADKITQTGLTFTSKAKLVTTIDPVKIANATKSTVKLTAATTLTGNEKIQFSLTHPDTNAAPAPVTCKIATDSKTTECEVEIATSGAYSMYVDLSYHGQTLTVSSGYLTLAFGLLFTLFLF